MRQITESVRGVKGIRISRAVVLVALLGAVAGIVVTGLHWWNTPSILVGGGFMYDESGNVTGFWDDWQSPSDFFGGTDE